MDPLSSHVRVHLETVNLFWKGVSQSCPGYIKNLFFTLQNLWNTDLGSMKKAELLSSRNSQCNCVVVVQLFSHIWLFVTPWTAAHQAYLSFTISWSLLKFMSVESVMITISFSATHFSFCLQSFPGPFWMSQFFTSGDRSIGASASATILPMNFRVEKTLKSPPAPQFESINSLALSLLYDPTLISVHDCCCCCCC